MSKLSERIPAFLKKSTKEPGKLDIVFVVRMIIAAALLAVACFVQMPTVLRYVLLAVSLIVAGYDLVVDAINSVEAGNFFASSLIILAAAIIAFCIAFPLEGAALVSVYQVGLRVAGYVDERSRKSALELLSEEDEELAARVQDRINENNAGELKLAGTVEKSASFVLKITMAFALLFVILMLFLGDFSLRTSLHRALMILIVCTPFSVVAAMAYTALQHREELDAQAKRVIWDSIAA